jgi:hypothetical protein
LIVGIRDCLAGRGPARDEKATAAVALLQSNLIVRIDISSSMRRAQYLGAR